MLNDACKFPRKVFQKKCSYNKVAMILLRLIEYFQIIFWTN
uniref:Uncharacterized protein n=1 Tax=Lepeophtheirus salmonis TaxID=72036 RepID=A0A0K2SY31_LEPSM